MSRPHDQGKQARKRDVVGTVRKKESVIKILTTPTQRAVQNH